MSDQERYQIFEQTLSLGKQMDYIRRGNNLSDLTIFMILSIIIFVVLNDYMDFVSTEKTRTITKILFGVCMFITAGLLVQKTTTMNERVSQMIHHEKKQAKKVFKKNLCIFQTKLISHLKCSPTDFAKTLTNYN